VENLIGEVSGLAPHYELHITREDSGVDRMEVKVEARPDAESTLDELTAALSSHLRENLGVKLEAVVFSPETLPRYELKSKRIFDHRSRAALPGNG